MLVVISDIHFVDGTAGEHNLPYEAFEDIFLSDIVALAVDKKAEELKLLLLGDIIDLLRSYKWLDSNKKNRPWGEKGLKDIPNPQNGSPTEKICLSILGFNPASPIDLTTDTPPSGLEHDTVLWKNWKTFNLMREFKERFNAKVKKAGCKELEKVELVYVPGNHDRMCNLYPSVREAVKVMLGLTVDSDTADIGSGGIWRYKNNYSDKNYSLLARHGHEFDVWNFADLNDFTVNGYQNVAIGDVITTEFATKIPWQVSQLMQTNKKYAKAITPTFLEGLKDIDNVRPLSKVMDWIYYRVKREDDKLVRDALNEAFDIVVKDMMGIKVVQNWRSPETKYDDYIRMMSSRWLSWLSKKVVDALEVEDILPIFMGMSGDPNDPEQDTLAQAAYNKELEWRHDEGINYILYGHTHTPLQMPLDRFGEREIIYINTGTWRKRVVKTIGLDKSHDFVDLKQMTYSVFYNKDEDISSKKQGTASFETWTGYKKKYYT